MSRRTWVPGYKLHEWVQDLQEDGGSGSRVDLRLWGLWVGVEQVRSRLWAGGEGGVLEEAGADGSRENCVGVNLLGGHSLQDTPLLQAMTSQKVMARRVMVRSQG